MIRGTTAQFKFKLPYKIDELVWIRIKFWQSNNPSKLLPITRTQDHCSLTDADNEICVSLTKEETTRFSDKYKAKVQLRAQLETGGTFGCKERLITVYPMRDADDPVVDPAPTDEGWIILDGGLIVDK